MAGPDDHQPTYWDGAGATKTFTHPIAADWLASRSARVLDYGCGYGRVTAELTDRGYAAFSGTDPSAALIRRGRRMRPDLRLDVLAEPLTLPHRPASVDVVLLFAVLTCIPDDRQVQRVITEVGRVLVPGGLVYLSDLVLQNDERRRARYAAQVEQSGSLYGVFATEDGAVFRHRPLDAWRALFGGLDLVAERLLEVDTLNGHRAQAVQLLARTRSSSTSK